jgi:hypothetical protein
MASIVTGTLKIADHAGQPRAEKGLNVAEYCGTLTGVKKLNRSTGANFFVDELARTVL